MLKAYRELETKGLTGRPGQGTFITSTLNQVALPELAGLPRLLLSWLTAADAAGLDDDGIVALVTSSLRDFRDNRGGSGAAGTKKKGIGMNVIEASGLGKRYGGTWAVRECALTIPAGSGCAGRPERSGKTTLPNLAVGLAAPTAGIVTVLGGCFAGSRRR